MISRSSPSECKVGVQEFLIDGQSRIQLRVDRRLPVTRYVFSKGLKGNPNLES